MPAAPPDELVLSLSCPDTPGIVHAVAGFLLQHGCNISTSQQFDDASNDRFFMRVQATAPLPLNLAGLRNAFRTTAEAFDMTWTLSSTAARPKVLIMVSRFEHCLNDLLFRWRSGQLKVDIVAIVSNHVDFEGVARSNGIPFHYIPVTADTKAAAEDKLLSLTRELDVSLIVLARYMQVLGDELCRELDGRIINIHHSFLPGFKGAKPYHQAFERGVKLVGATAHYVTAELDEGPIIEQEVIRVDHNYSADALVVAGRDAERVALAKAVQWHAEHRVLRNGHRTIVFK